MYLIMSIYTTKFQYFGLRTEQLKVIVNLLAIEYKNSKPQVKVTSL